MSLSDRLVFEAEWFDPNAELSRKYQVMFYRSDNTVEMFDIKNRRLFLKRCSIPHITEDVLYIGSIVNINSRQLTLTSYGDAYTERSLSNRNERTLGMIRPDAIPHLGQILEAIEKEGIKICNCKMLHLAKVDAASFYAEYTTEDFFDDLVRSVVSGPLVVLELMGPNVINKWNKMTGPTSPENKNCIPSELRPVRGTPKTSYNLHGSESPTAAKRELEFFFGLRRLNGTAVIRDTTLCLIKPHAITERSMGKIISEILSAGFEIRAMEMFSLDRANAEEFLEVYKGVVTEYSQMVAELCSGPILAIEVHGQHQKFREFVGPADPDIGRHLRPHTLRAKYGHTKTQNAVHCTDLHEDVSLEVEYFFRILSS